MASHVFTGIASGYDGLLLNIIAHLTDATTLGGEVWTVEKWEAPTVYLKAPGLSNSDNIHINIRTVEDLGTDVFNWEVSAAVAFNTLSNFENQPGVSPFGHLCLWDSSIPYWLIVNGRRMILIAKVSTTYQTLYAGFYLPYSTSSEMPYPIAVMTSCGNNMPLVRWSVGTYQIGGFWDPIAGSSYIRHWNGSWVSIENLSYRTDTSRQELTDSNVWPWEKDYGFSINLDSKYGVLPAVMHSNYGEGNVLGELDGVYFISGFSAAVEDTVIINLETYLIVQSSYRTGRRDYAAIKLG